MNRADDPDLFNARQMDAAFFHSGQDWQAAQEVAWRELADRLTNEDMPYAAAMVGAWCTRDPKHIKRVRAGVRRARRQETT